MTQPGPIGIREAGSKWEKLLGMPHETWILRQEFSGNLLAIVSRMRSGSMTWCIKAYMPNGRTAEGVVIENGKIPSVFSEAEGMLVDAGVSFSPVVGPS